eukprot:SAG31_NODE_20678_length_568_cov_0.752665_1_plen_39_part_10
MLHITAARATRHPAYKVVCAVYKLDFNLRCLRAGTFVIG